MKSLQSNLTNENKKPDVSNIDTYEFFRELIGNPELIWLAEFIWHHQQFESFKNENHQKWQIESRQGKKPYQNKLLITCYKGITVPPKNSELVLASITVNNFYFPFKQMTIVYQGGACSLVNTNSQDMPRQVLGT